MCPLNYDWCEDSRGELPQAARLQRPGTTRSGEERDARLELERVRRAVRAWSTATDDLRRLTDDRCERSGAA